MKKIKDFYLDENKWVGKAKVRKAIKDMREKLKKYKFRISESFSNITL